MSSSGPSTRVAVIHTSSLTEQTYDALFAEIGPELQVVHVVDASLLSDWREKGGRDQALADRVAALVERALSQSVSLILSQCSSIGDVVSEISERCVVPLLRVDEPMVEAAIQAGKRIGVLATLPTTLEPTRNLIIRSARALERDVEVTLRVVDGAFDLWANGDLKAHDALIRRALETLSEDVDVILCAQGSMAGAISTLPARRVPIFTSPMSGVVRAVERARVREEIGASHGEVDGK